MYCCLSTEWVWHRLLRGSERVVVEQLSLVEQEHHQHTIHLTMRVFLSSPLESRDTLQLILNTVIPNKHLCKDLPTFDYWPQTFHSISIPLFPVDFKLINLIFFYSLLLLDYVGKARSSEWQNRDDRVVRSMVVNAEAHSLEASVYDVSMAVPVHMVSEPLHTTLQQLLLVSRWLSEYRSICGGPSAMDDSLSTTSPANSHSRQNSTTNFTLYKSVTLT